uniref:Uncharacterized protein n=1 Tax=Oryzias latipes TaxID=8090 RepID=A0A286P9Y2_ORYLA|nr:hypothetical protein [Oryzias latipes]
MDEGKVSDGRELIKARVLERAAERRHLSSADLAVLFPECEPRPGRCSCEANGDPNPMCPRCTPVLAVLELLARNPKPLMASFAERAVPGRALARNTYDRALLTEMLNDRGLPRCANRNSCKGMLVNVRTGPLTTLMSPEAYKQYVLERDKVQRSGDGEPNIVPQPSCCVLCLLFNQSAAVAQMCGSQGLRLETPRTDPVYYFNVKFAPDVGLPEVSVRDYQGFLVNFQGSVGSYKPAFYYNWRHMLEMLHRDASGAVTLIHPGQRQL